MSINVTLSTTEIVLGAPDQIVVDVALSGLQGAAGPAGAAGTAGAPGMAATVAVGTVGAVAYPGPGTVTNVGTAGAAILDFTLVTGPQGQGATVGTARPQAVGTATAAAGTALEASATDHVHAIGAGVATLDSPTFAGTVVLPSTTSIGNVSATEIGYLDGVTSGLQSQLANKAASSDLPEYVYVTWTQPPTAATGAPIISIDANLYLNGGMRYTATTIDAFFEMSVGALRAGQYSLTLDLGKNNGCGIVSVSIDGGSALATTVDGYFNGTGKLTATITGIAVAGAGKHTVRLTSSTKNASATGYMIRFSGLQLTRTGD